MFPVCCGSSADIIFLLDGSGSIGSKNWAIVLNWTATVAGSFDIANGDIAIGVIQYSHYYNGLVFGTFHRSLFKNAPGNIF